jgi:hypothetical protein
LDGEIAGEDGLFDLADLVDKITSTCCLRLFFGSEVVRMEEMEVQLVTGQGPKKMILGQALRYCMHETSTKLKSKLRMMSLDPLHDWALTPSERTIKANQLRVKFVLGDLITKFIGWRERNQMQEEDTIYLYDLVLADETIKGDKDYILDEIVSCLYQSTNMLTSTILSTVIQLQRHRDNLFKVLQKLDEIEETFNVKKLVENFDVTNPDLLIVEQSVSEA